MTSIASEDRFDAARAVADAVLDEGHILYPYRASAMKNRMRWQFGILGPPRLADEPGAEPSWCRTIVVARAPVGDALAVAVRWLQPAPTAAGEWQSASMVERRIETRIGAPAERQDEAGTAIEITSVTHDGGWAVIEVTVRNTSTAELSADPVRHEVLTRSRVGVHTMLALAAGHFESSVDPSSEARSLADPAGNVRTWPVLVGRSTILSCPVILYDQPELAPEVDARGCDALEIEELLALRVATLTPTERAEAAATDPVAAMLVSRHAQLDAEQQWGLHGRRTLHPWSDARPEPSAAGVEVPGPGADVVLRPRRQADAQDMFLAGRTATVIATEVDVDGRPMVRVVLHDDPGRDMHEWHGRSWFFGVDEVEPT